jgi:hypothetical protein
VSSNNRILADCLKYPSFWCVMALIGTWFYLLYTRSYGVWALTAVFVLIAVFGLIDQFVLDKVTPDRITIIPEMRSDLTPDSE